MTLPFFALLSGIVLFSSTVAAVTHDINVGDNLKFNPPYINATAGDIVSFTFTSNFSATQSSLNAPCTPQAGGLDTGFVYAAGGGTGNTNLATAQFNVTDTAPIWVHCRQGSNTSTSHCGQGMVFAVNPGPDDSNESFSIFQANALAVGAQLASSATSATASQPSKSTGFVSSGLSTSTSTSTSNGETSLNIGGAMLSIAAFGTVVSLIA